MSFTSTCIYGYRSSLGFGTILICIDFHEMHEKLHGMKFSGLFSAVPLVRNRNSLKVVIE